MTTHWVWHKAFRVRDALDQARGRISRLWLETNRNAEESDDWKALNAATENLLEAFKTIRKAEAAFAQAMERFHEYDDKKKKAEARDG